MEHVHFGTRRIFAAHSNLALDVASASRELGAPLIQWPRTENANQVFESEHLP